jgi:hypothetical protein
MGMSNAERQARLREEREKAGLVSVTLYIPRVHIPAVKAAIAQLIAFPYLEIGALRDTRTGKLARVDK